MKIYINDKYEIKAINSTDDETLQEIEIDREKNFGDKSDFMILNYCYKTDEYGFSIYPAKDYSIIELLDEYVVSKISSLEEENKALREELTQIQTSIASLSALILTTLEEK